MDSSHPEILIVDDDPASLLLAKSALGQAGYQNVDGFLNPLDAQQSYQQKNYDLLILDIRMPELNGFDILQDIQSIHSRKPNVIVLTAQADPGTRSQALELGAQQVMIKPYKVKELLQEVENQLCH